MAQYFPIAYDYLMEDEDSTHAHETVPDNCPENCAQKDCYAISGINSGAHPSAYAEIAAIPPKQRGPKVRAFYLQNYWTPLNLINLNSQDIANRVLSQGVNGGLRTGARLLQQACNQLGAFLTVDGDIGPKTLAAANRIDEALLLATFRAVSVARLKEVAKTNAKVRARLKQLIARAER